MKVAAKGAEGMVWGQCLRVPGVVGSGSTLLPT
jgi:hypothetical protein